MRLYLVTFRWYWGMWQTGHWWCHISTCMGHYSEPTGQTPNPDRGPWGSEGPCSGHVSSFTWSCFPRFQFCGCSMLSDAGPFIPAVPWPAVLSPLSALLGCSPHPLDFLHPSDSAPQSSSVSFLCFNTHRLIFLCDWIQSYLYHRDYFVSHLCPLSGKLHRNRDSFILFTIRVRHGWHSVWDIVRIQYISVKRINEW